MTTRTPAWLLSLLFFIAIILGAITAHALFETPNTTWGGDAKLIALILFAVIYRAILVGAVRRFRNRKAAPIEADPDSYHR